MFFMAEIVSICEYCMLGLCMYIYCMYKTISSLSMLRSYACVFFFYRKRLVILFDLYAYKSSARLRKRPHICRDGRVCILCFREPHLSAHINMVVVVDVFFFFVDLSAKSLFNNTNKISKTNIWNHKKIYTHKRDSSWRARDACGEAIGIWLYKNITTESTVWRWFIFQGKGYRFFFKQTRKTHIFSNIFVCITACDIYFVWVCFKHFVVRATRAHRLTLNMFYVSRTSSKLSCSFLLPLHIYKTHRRSNNLSLFHFACLFLNAYMENIWIRV